MKLNEVTANLDIIASSVHSLDVKSKMFKITNENKREFSLDIKYSKPIVNDDCKIGKLLMHINVAILQENQELEPDTLDLVIEGAFSSPAEVSDEEFMGLLNINGGAALYSIARAKIEAISSLTYAEGKILLPMVNIIQYYKEKNSSDK